jgi:hypothetical protein
MERTWLMSEIESEAERETNRDDENIVEPSSRSRILFD